MITNIRKNCMGTVSFDGKFDGMRKAQDFIVYPMHAGNDTSTALVQSDTRIGRIHLSAGGSYGVHIAFAKPAGKLTGEELLLLKSQIFATAHGNAGNNGIVYTDNSGAMEVFQS